jgi:hypothetical protein
MAERDVPDLGGQSTDPPEQGGNMPPAGDGDPPAVPNSVANLREACDLVRFAVEDQIAYALKLRDARRTILALCSVFGGVAIFKMQLFRSGSQIPVLVHPYDLAFRHFYVFVLLVLLLAIYRALTERPLIRPWVCYILSCRWAKRIWHARHSMHKLLWGWVLALCSGTPVASEPDRGDREEDKARVGFGPLSYLVYREKHHKELQNWSVESMLSDKLKRLSLAYSDINSRNADVRKRVVQSIGVFCFAALLLCFLITFYHWAAARCAERPNGKETDSLVQVTEPVRIVMEGHPTGEHTNGGAACFSDRDSGGSGDREYCSPHRSARGCRDDTERIECPREPERAPQEERAGASSQAPAEEPIELAL